MDICRQHGITVHKFNVISLFQNRAAQILVQETGPHSHLLSHCRYLYAFLSIALPTTKAHNLLIALWVIAGIGTVFKLIFIHRFQKISLLAYLLMGWMALLVMDDMRQYLSKQTITLLIAGGLAYTIGALFYALKE